MAIKKEHKVRGNRETDLLFTRSKILKGRFLSVRLRKNEKAKTRILISVPAKIAKTSVLRHKTKRQIEEWLSKHIDFSNNNDLGIVVMRLSDKDSLHKELDNLLKLANERDY